MSNVGYNAPQYGYAGGVPPQPMPMPMPATEPDTDDNHAPAVASYDVDPSAGHAPPLVVQPAEQPPTAAITLDKPPAEAPEPAADEPEPTAAAPEPAAPTSPASSGRVAVQVVDRLRSTAERGTTTVPTPVIEKIATLAVREVPGVHEFATGATAPADGEKPLAISLDGKTATIEIHLVIEYGFAVHSVTEKVRTKVISALENLFGLDVTAVDIVIDDIHLEVAEPAVE
jgi:uncharacterized alkaline shock family protein YloU